MKNKKNKKNREIRGIVGGDKVLKGAAARQSDVLEDDAAFDSRTLSLIFNRPLYNLEQVLTCSESENNYDELLERTVFVRLTSIAFRDRRDIRKALSQFYGVLHAMDATFWYVLEGDATHEIINLYLGIVSDPVTDAAAVAGADLTGCLLGLLPGCQAEVLSTPAKQKFIDKISNYHNSALVTGVPTCLVSWDKREQYQEEEKARTGIERIIDSLSGENFALSILCKPLGVDELREYRTNVAELHNIVKPLTKYTTTVSEAMTEGNTKSVNITVTHGASHSDTHGTGSSNSTSESETTGENTSRVHKDGALIDLGLTTDAKDALMQFIQNPVKSSVDAVKSSVSSIFKNIFKPEQAAEERRSTGRIMRSFDRILAGGPAAEFTKSEQRSTTRGTSITKSQNTSNTDTTSNSESRSRAQSLNISDTRTVGMNREVSNMELSALCEQLGKLHKRLVNAEGNGMWKACVMFHADNQLNLKRAAYAGISIWSGDDSAYDPMRCQTFEKSNEIHRSQHSLVDLQFTTNIDGHDEPVHPFGAPYSNFYTCLSHSELAHVADFPHWDVPGISVRPLVEYARNSPKPRAGVPTVKLGGLIDRTVNSKTGVDAMPEVNIGYDQLNKHCFVCGVTGSGKSTTMRRLLTEIALHREAPVNFMVLEPVKTEYRVLEKEKIGLVRFSPGRSGGEDFALNPFSFPEGVSLFSHLDFLKTAFNALLGSYSSMPFILEALLCAAYKQKGWNLETSENRLLNKELSVCVRESQRWHIREKYMPLIGDLSLLVDNVMTGFFGKDKSDYSVSLRGALKARLNSLCASHKGRLLNRPSTHDFADLLKKNVLIELEAFSDNEEKSFIMALLLGRMYEYRQVEYQSNVPGLNKLRHVVVLEEAHRLLTRTESKGELQASPRSKAVEVFSDMLAEVRAYGQGMIIVDQIPSKLTPEVMKNTEVKIAHRLLAKDDREAVGATMNLSKEQIEDLARHDAGEATMYFGNLVNAMHVKINEHKL